MSTSIKAIEESIKIALDAADTATGVTAEFETIRTQYDQARKEVKRVNRHAIGIFASSVIAILIATAAAGFMYYRTLGEMRASNSTTLEGLLIFAENVDKLVVAIGRIEALEQTNARLLEALQATTTSIDGLAQAMAAQPEAIGAQIMAGLAAEDGPMVASMGQLEQTLAAGFAAQAEAATALQSSLSAQAEAAAARSAESGSNSDLLARIEAMVLLQQEVSAKITAMQARPTAAASASAARPQTRPSTPPRPAAPAAPAGDVIKFP